jgi:hypothetical protein
MADRLDQRQIDHLARAAADLDRAQRRERRGGAPQPGKRVGHGERRQHRRAVGKAVHRGKAGERLDQRAEARLVPPRPALAPAGHADHDQLRVAREQHVRTQAHLLERAGAIVLDQHLRRAGEAEQQLAPGVLAQIEAEALLVARVDLPPQRHALRLPVPEVVAAARLLDLDHLGAEVGQHVRQDVARDQARQVQHPHAIERAPRGRVELVRLHRRAASAQSPIIATERTALQGGAWRDSPPWPGGER